MLIKTSHQDVKTESGDTMRVFIYEPNVPEYPEAKFPGVVCFSEIYQVTGPVERFASNSTLFLFLFLHCRERKTNKKEPYRIKCVFPPSKITVASAGYVVACPSSFHEWEGPEAIPYDVAGTDKGNKYKAEKTVEAYDEDCTLSIDLLTQLNSCNGRIAATGMCLGGHLALRASFDVRVLASFCYFATDVHCSTLGLGSHDDTLARIKSKTIKGEVGMVFGKQDNHVPREGRTLIRDTLDDAGTVFSFYEVQAQHAFIRDNSSKGRWDAALSRSLFGVMMELFERTVGRDLGPRKGLKLEMEHFRRFSSSFLPFSLDPLGYIHAHPGVKIHRYRIVRNTHSFTTPSTHSLAYPPTSNQDLVLISPFEEIHRFKHCPFGFAFLSILLAEATYINTFFIARDHPPFLRVSASLSLRDRLLPSLLYIYNQSLILI
ncbi:E [Phaffia rhodozyma]|uniref:E n=1 Tax=Phaffia rhodozyma TaxID=264483 RepID=A0A0F7SPX1_PHARH|nr:E [Phaffia rhodozyma] [Phaffia rhodozyma]